VKIVILFITNVLTIQTKSFSIFCQKTYFNNSYDRRSFDPLYPFLTTLLGVHSRCSPESVQKWGQNRLNLFISIQQSSGFCHQRSGPGHSHWPLQSRVNLFGPQDRNRHLSERVPRERPYLGTLWICALHFKTVIQNPRTGRYMS